MAFKGTGVGMCVTFGICEGVEVLAETISSARSKESCGGYANATTLRAPPATNTAEAKSPILVRVIPLEVGRGSTVYFVPCSINVHNSDQHKSPVYTPSTTSNGS